MRFKGFLDRVFYSLKDTDSVLPFPSFQTPFPTGREEWREGTHGRGPIGRADAESPVDITLGGHDP